MKSNSYKSHPLGNWVILLHQRLSRQNHVQELCFLGKSWKWNLMATVSELVLRNNMAHFVFKNKKDSPLRKSRNGNAFDCYAEIDSYISIVECKNWLVCRLLIPPVDLCVTMFALCLVHISNWISFLIREIGTERLGKGLIAAVPLGFAWKIQFWKEGDDQVRCHKQQTHPLPGKYVDHVITDKKFVQHSS